MKVWMPRRFLFAMLIALGTLFWSAALFNQATVSAQEPTDPPEVTVAGGEGVEGELIAITVAWTNPAGADELFIQIDWGDGIVGASFPVQDSDSPFNPTHLYEAPGDYTVVVHVCDAGDNCGQDSATVIINEPPATTDCMEQVTFAPIPSTVVTDSTPVAGGPAGTFSFTARMTNTSSADLKDIVTPIETLTNDNLVLNADGGPAGEGGQVTVAEVGDYADGVLSPGETVDVTYEIGLAEISPFDFFVGVTCAVTEGSGIE